MKDDDRASMIAMLENMRARLAPEGTQVGSAIHKSRELLAETIDVLKSIRHEVDGTDGDDRANLYGSEAVQESEALPLPADAEPPASSNPSHEDREPVVAGLITTAPTLSSSVHTQMPMSSSSPHAEVSAQARDEEEKAIPKNREHRDVALPDDVGEAAVTFVIRENVGSPRQASSPARAATHRLHRTDGEGHYLANRKTREEAEVVVVKPQMHQPGPDQRPPKGGLTRRLMSALRGG